MVWLFPVVVLTATGACGDKGTTKPMASAQAALSASAAGSSSGGAKCGAGEALEGGKCVAVVAPAKVRSLEDEVKELGDLDAQFAKLEKVKAVLVLLDLFMQSDAWKAAEKAKPSLADASDVVSSLKDAVKKLERLQSSIKSSRDLVKGLVDVLAGSEAGKQAVAEVAKVKAEVKAKLDAVAAELDATGADFSAQVIEPALAEFDKIDLWVEAVCAIVTLSGGDDLKKACKEADDTTREAKEFLESAKSLPGKLVRDLTASLETSLGELVQGTALEKFLAPPAASQ